VECLNCKKEMKLRQHGPTVIIYDCKCGRSAVLDREGKIIAFGRWI